MTEARMEKHGWLMMLSRCERDIDGLEEKRKIIGKQIDEVRAVRNRAKRKINELDDGLRTQIV